jgi:hypothetical protein
MVDLGALFSPPITAPTAAPGARATMAGIGATLVGPSGSGKTQLAFNCALNAALAGGRPVLVCHKPKITASPPSLPPGASLTPLAPALRAIAIKYLTSDRQLCEYLLSLHCLPPSDLPTLLIIDDLRALLLGAPRPAARPVLACLALLADTVRWIATATGRPTTYLVIDDTEGPLHHLPPHAGPRWSPTVLRILPVVNGATHTLVKETHGDPDGPAALFVLEATGPRFVAWGPPGDRTAADAQRRYPHTTSG